MPSWIRLVNLMKQLPNLRVELSGHTDNTGSEVLNNRLSQKRAEAVVDYLISKGISAELAFNSERLVDQLLQSIAMKPQKEGKTTEEQNLKLVENSL